MKKKVLVLTVILMVFSITCIFAIATETESLAQEFVRMLSADDYENACMKFDTTVKNSLPAAKLEEVWKSIQNKCGAFKIQSSVRKEKTDQLTVIIVTCDFEKASLDVKLVFNDKNEISGLWFSPAGREKTEEPVELPDGIHEKELTIENQGFKLPAVLTLPLKEGIHPVLILVHGSGPNDRDETIGPNKPFRDIAWGLAKKGIAVLRYDKRTKVYGAAAFSKEVTVQEEAVDDVPAAIMLLKTLPEIDANRIFVLGHSLGGLLIPRIAEKCPDARGFIVMAGPTRRLEDILLEQYSYIFSLDGKLSDEAKTQLETIRKQIETVKSPQLSSSTPVSELPLNTPASYWLDLRDYNPASEAVKIDKNLLILQGARDYQTTTADFKIWQQTLSDRKNVEFKLYPDLNHLFMKGEGKSIPSEYSIAGHMDASVIDDISTWIANQK